MARLLLIDDDEVFRPMLRENLEQMGHTVTEARNGKEGLAQYALDPADLVFTDLIMPEKEGIETIMELKRKWPGARIIAMSGGGRVGASNYLGTAQKLGAAHVLAKPFSNDELIAAIDKVLPRGES